MKAHGFIGVIVVPIIGMLAVGFDDVQAQELECGTNCASCGYMQSMGVNYDPDFGIYEIKCETFALCTELDCGELVSDAHPSARSLVEMISRATGDELEQLVQEHRERLLVHPSRSLLVVLHRTKCEPDRVAENLKAVAILPATTAQTIDRLGVTRLGDFTVEGATPK